MASLIAGVASERPDIQYQTGNNTFDAISFGEVLVANSAVQRYGNVSRWPGQQGSCCVDLPLGPDAIPGCTEESPSLNGLWLAEGRKATVGVSDRGGCGNL